VLNTGQITWQEFKSFNIVIAWRMERELERISIGLLEQQMVEKQLSVGMIK
jgi:hypothetical protein